MYSCHDQTKIGTELHYPSAPACHMAHWSHSCVTPNKHLCSVLQQVLVFQHLIVEVLLSRVLQPLSQSACLCFVTFMVLDFKFVAVCFLFYLFSKNLRLHPLPSTVPYTLCCRVFPRFNKTAKNNKDTGALRSHVFILPFEEIVSSGKLLLFVCLFVL